MYYKNIALDDVDIKKTFALENVDVDEKTCIIKNIALDDVDEKTCIIKNIALDDVDEKHVLKKQLT